MKTAKSQALQDIKDDLKKEGKVFLAYKQELNMPIREIVKSYLKSQKKKKKKKNSYCLSFYSKIVSYETEEV